MINRECGGVGGGGEGKAQNENNPETDPKIIQSYYLEIRCGFLAKGERYSY